MCYITAAWIKSFLMKRRYHGVKGGKKERECSINLGESQPDQISSVCTTFLCQLQDLCGLPMVWYTVQKSCTGGEGVGYRTFAHMPMNLPTNMLIFWIYTY